MRSVRTLAIAFLLASFLASPFPWASDTPPAGAVTVMVGESDAATADRLSRDGEPGRLARSKARCGCAPAATPEASQALVVEREDNDVAGQATALGGTNVVGWGNIYPSGDVDFFSFQANAGDRVYAATMTSGSSAVNFDTILDLIGSNGATVLETDDNDGSLGASSSSIAGRTIPSSGTYYLRVTALGGIPQVRPYFLHVRVQPAATTPESEPNDSPATANVLPAGGHVSGVHLTSDVDWFQISLNAGDSLYLSLDADPERNAATWNPRMGVGLFGDAGDQVLTVDDASATSPNSEALFVTVQQGGTYYVRVDSSSSAGSIAQTYNLSVSVHPATPASAVCTTYTSTDVPVAIADGAGPVTSTISVPGNPRIYDLDVSLQLNHPLMADLDVILRGPGGNDVGLFTDIGSTAAGGQSQLDLTLDDEAAFPLSASTVLKGLVCQTEAKFGLRWFDGQDAGGTWTLRLWDDTANGSAGLLTGWSITVCEPPPPVACSGTTVTLYSSDFETDDAGFTHSGTPDEWQRGLPSGASDPILSCNSGTSCWKTNLMASTRTTRSCCCARPAFSLAGLTAPIRATWAQVSQMENASFDAMEVDVDNLDTGNIENLYLWLDGTQDDDVGVLNVDYIPMRSGWAIKSGNLDAYAGANVQLVFGVGSDNFVGYSGLGIDDVTVTGCCTAASCTDGDPCTSDTCDAALGCVHAPLTGGSCNDGNACTVNDTCNAGVCAGTPVPPPAEVNGSLRLAKSGTTAFLQWSDPPGPFNVYRGVSPRAGWAYNHGCFAALLAGPPSTDGASPSAGDSYYYLITRDVCGDSIPGRDSAGSAHPALEPLPVTRMAAAPSPQRRGRGRRQGGALGRSPTLTRRGRLPARRRRD